MEQEERGQGEEELGWGEPIKREPSESDPGERDPGER